MDRCEKRLALVQKQDRRVRFGNSTAFLRQRGPADSTERTTRARAKCERRVPISLSRASFDEIGLHQPIGAAMAQNVERQAAPFLPSRRLDGAHVGPADVGPASGAAAARAANPIDALVVRCARVHFTMAQPASDTSRTASTRSRRS
jgi:hypothetical protein